MCSSLVHQRRALRPRAVRQTHVRFGKGARTGRKAKQHGFLAPCPGVIQRREQRVISGRRRVLAFGSDPGSQKTEELTNPLR